MTAYTRAGGATITTAGAPGLTGVGYGKNLYPRLISTGIIDFSVRTVASASTMKVLWFQPQTIVLGVYVLTVATVTASATCALSDGTNTYLTATAFGAAGAFCTQDAISVANSRAPVGATALSLTMTIGTTDALAGKIVIYALVQDLYWYGSTTDHNTYT